VSGHSFLSPLIFPPTVYVWSVMIIAEIG